MFVYRIHTLVTCRFQSAPHAVDGEALAQRQFQVVGGDVGRWRQTVQQRIDGNYQHAMRGPGQLVQGAQAFGNDVLVR